MNELKPIVSGCKATYEKNLDECTQRETCERYRIYLEGKKSPLPDGWNAHRMCRSRGNAFYIQSTIKETGEQNDL